VKAVLVTGASRGIGEATALHLAERGFHVLAGVRKAEDGAALQAKARGRITPVRLDVRDAASIAAAREQAEQHDLFGLVNNAGVAAPGPLEHLDLGALREVFEVNVFATVALTQALVPLLRRSGGRVVNVGSPAGRAVVPLNGAYSASKLALEALTDAWRLELGPSGVHVSLVLPGAIRTGIFDHSRAVGDEQWEAMPLEAQERYAPMREALDRFVAQLVAQAIPPEAVARAVGDALTARRPRAEYLVGMDARLGNLMRHLPAGARTGLVRRWLRVKR
jgi:NAD(P)-dependent dehydrogenase (short-subunit alcohol dehydrogenase family)